MVTMRGKTLRQLAKRAAVRALGFLGIHRRHRVPSALRTELLDEVDPWFRSRLLSMYRAEPQIGADGKEHPIGNVPGMSPEEGYWLYGHCLGAKPKATLEIGMAFGYSTLYFLAALAVNGQGTHTAVDPLQSSVFFGVALTQAQDAVREKGLGSDAFLLIEDRSDRAAVDLVREGRTFDVVFIDGNHRFDDVLVDFYLCAPLCSIGGHVVLHDMWMSSIHTVAKYLRANRADFEWVPTPAGNLGVFKKVSEDSRDWRHFRNFDVLGDQG